MLKIFSFLRKTPIFRRKLAKNAKTMIITLTPVSHAGKFSPQALPVRPGVRLVDFQVLDF
jgi:hypothetical protein